MPRNDNAPTVAAEPLDRLGDVLARLQAALADQPAAGLTLARIAVAADLAAARMEKLLARLNKEK